MCIYDKKCLCSYQHSHENIEENIEIKCDMICKTEKDMDTHMDDANEEWRLTQSFCDCFCRGEHGTHIYVGLKVLVKVSFKCLKCEETDKD